MQVIEFNNAFCVVERIQSVIIQPVTATSEALFKATTEHDQSSRWFIQIAYHNNGAFKSYFDNEEDVTEAYNQILKAVKNA